MRGRNKGELGVVKKQTGKKILQYDVSLIYTYLLNVPEFNSKEQNCLNHTSFINKFYCLKLQNQNVKMDH